ncbi:hypothetical protein [Thalassobaculum litoreum]|uniref:Uncharacterized protein n=1 Tax=Thalassobaculum litoreum DSM 18839 TaxID=1123362 RepID=A0A8G2F1L1_9PROT|nr:hypothetical protein [Thalassobaculum litoreum]SDF18561.1 hypothetical protein SAMN05660686_00621 [Thalassobaculum litoreum DSM 18839]
MSDDERLSDIDRRSLRILAQSSKSSASGARLKERLERAADSGLRQDYQRAEQTFDSLPPEDRLMISAKAEKQATTERDLLERRRRAVPTRDGKAGAPTANRPPIIDDEPLQWKPIFQDAAAETPPPPPKQPKRPAKRQARAEDDEAGMAWKLGAMPGNPKMPSVGRAAKAPTPKPAPPAEDDWDPEDDHKDWDWRKLPDDPVLNGGRKKGGAVDPIEELRRQMLGLDSKVGKR